MREILFRGKTVDGEAWITGDLVRFINYSTVLNQYEKHYFLSVDQKRGAFFIKENILVIPGTIGQFTGELDKNSKRIFEGDVVKDHRDGSLNVVCWSNYGFELHDVEHEAITMFLRDGLPIEVIGNIHDNPELLEVKDVQNIK